MLEALRTQFDAVPINRYLRLALEDRSESRCVVRAEVIPEYTQEHGVIHGALISAYADTAAVWLFHPDLPPGYAMASIEFKVNFLAPAFVDGGALLAEGSLVRRGRRVGVATSDVTQKGELVAKGLFTYMFFEKRT